MTALHRLWSGGMRGSLNPFAAFGVLLAGILLFIALFLSIEMAGGLMSHYELCRRCPYTFEIWMLLSVIAIVGLIVALLWGLRDDRDPVRRSSRPLPIRLAWQISVAVWAVFMLVVAVASIPFYRHIVWAIRVEISAEATFLPALIAFSLIWTMRVAAHHGVRILQGSARGAAIDLLKGTLGAGLGLIVAASIMHWRGADLLVLAAPQLFYGLLIPALAGFGWTAAWPKTGSRWFSAAIVFMAFGMALFSMKYSYAATTKPRCEPLHQAGTHCVSGTYSEFCREPWMWQWYFPGDILFVPSAVGQLSVNYIWHPLASLRC